MRVIQPHHQPWLSKLLGYDFEVVYHPRVENKVANTLSRKHEGIELANLVVPTLLDVVVIKEEVYKDSKLKGITEKLLENEDSLSNYSLEQRVLKFRGRLVISKTSSLLPSILHTYHDFVFGGHSSFLRTYKRLLGELYWEGMKGGIKKYVEERLVCQRNKLLAHHQLNCCCP